MKLPVRHNPLFNHGSACKWLVYVRRFQPLLKSDIARIKELSKRSTNLVIAILQLCYDPHYGYHDDSINHPALNPFSFWENYLWLTEALAQFGATSTMIVPLPWYQYSLNKEELDDSNRRLWIPDPIEAYLPEDSLFCLENDDLPLINFLQDEVGPAI